MPTYSSDKAVMIGLIAFLTLFMGGYVVGKDVAIRENENAGLRESEEGLSRTH